MKPPPPLGICVLVWLVCGSLTALAQVPPAMITQPGSYPSPNGPTVAGRPIPANRVTPKRLVSLPPPPPTVQQNDPQATQIPAPNFVPVRPPIAPAAQMPPNQPFPAVPFPNATLPGNSMPNAALSAFPPASAVTPTAPSNSVALPPFPASNHAPPTTLVAYGTEATQADTAPQTQEFSAGHLIAVVGTEHILAGDMAVFVEPIIDQNRARIATPEEEQKVRDQLTRQVLRQYCEVKAIYQEFFRDMVGTVPPKKLQETKDKVVTRAGKIFFDNQVPVLMEKYKVESIQDLERKLNDKSLSLMTLRNQFIEQVLAQELERKYVPNKFEIDRQDLLEAYLADKQKNLWDVSGRARWRQLTVRFDKHPSRQVAEEKIRQLGNEIFLGGKSFDAVARQSSEGYTASEGGLYDWTTQGSLKSTQLDQALFSLPLNSLSQVIADDIGLHIIEVLEREEGHIKDFTEAQAELRERLSEEKRNKEVRAFRDRILARTTIWTLWPEDIPGSKPLTDALGIEAN